MKEMVYKPNREIEVLDKGEYGGRKYLILSLGIHPTAYVSVSDKEQEIIKSSLNGNKYDLAKYYSPLLANVYVHCRFTFYGTRTNYGDNSDTIYLGWDYGHSDDFNGIYLNSCYAPPDVVIFKRWTTAEISEEVKSVIEQLNELEAFK